MQKEKNTRNDKVRKKPGKLKKFLTIIVGLFVVFFVIGSFSEDDTEPAQTTGISKADDSVTDSDTVEKDKALDTDNEAGNVTDSTSAEKENVLETDSKAEGDSNDLPSIEPTLEDDDFNVYDADGYNFHTTLNLTEYWIDDNENYVDRPVNGYLYYYDPTAYDFETDIDDQSTASIRRCYNAVVKTQRGIQTGDKQSAVIKAYGQGKSGQVADDNWLFDSLGEPVKKFLRETCATYRLYKEEGGKIITFYFDRGDELACILYTMIDEYEIEATDEEIRALYGTYINKEDNKYEMTVGDDGSSGVSIDLTKSGENVFHCPSARLESTRFVDYEEMPSTMLEIHAADDETLVITVESDDMLCINDVYSVYFGNYIKN